MIIRCHICNADPCGRWKSPPAMIFCDPRTAALETTLCTPAATIYRRSERKRFESGRRIAGGRRESCDERSARTREVSGSCDIQRMTRRQEFASESALVLRNRQ
jgi:hypothetical protein